MTDQADQIRSRRRAFAAPGGSHDRLVHFLARWLPAGIGVVLALMIFVPLTPRGEISFLLDRNKVAVAPDRLSVDNAMYRGQDAKGRPFSIVAGRAVQRSASEQVVRMTDLEARILLPDGPAMLSAASGAYDIEGETVAVQGLVRFTAADGYRMVARDVAIDLEARTLRTDGPVEGAIPAGTFSANSLSVDLPNRAIVLDGQARLRMEPGKLRVP